MVNNDFLTTSTDAYIKFMMDYREALKQDPTAINAAELNFYSKFNRYANTNVGDGHNKGNVHRCHLVEDFLRVYNLDNIIEKKDIAYSLGVKHSLQILMDFYKDKNWLIAVDNYPVYLTKASTNNLNFETFPTLRNSLASSLESSYESSEVLLLSYPFKPSGALYEASDWEAINNWKGKRDDRVVILDAVYCLTLDDEKDLLNFFNSNDNIVVLYSLSKSYSAPNVAGFTFTKNLDLRSVFQKLKVSLEAMQMCYTLLNYEEGSNRKKEVSDFIDNQFNKALELGLVSNDTVNTGYLYYVEDLPEVSKNILRVTPDVFGSHEKNGYIISTVGL